ncbi:hypothetical protein FIBSPDRAFT_882516 [Athelia psychrophila]|uniref:C2 domain-containing protein n=1 Tax=Athelia psychrophila TaxID=1759441 RepID=A0A166VGH3_9AGAM|nr:hypothetical protein FIBSPDRAFT_882516 [Fibularhizoctonia sp. CBS 109695]
MHYLCAAAAGLTISFKLVWLNGLVTQEHKKRSFSYPSHPNSTGHHSSIVRIEIKSVAHNSSESLTIARTDTSLGNLLESCADGRAAALELTVAPLMPDMRGHITVTDVGNGPKHSTPDSIGSITVKLSRPSHNPPTPLEPSSVYVESTPQMGDLEKIITAVEAATPPQGSNVDSPVVSIQESEQLGTENLVSTKAAIDSNERSNFLLFVGAAEWTRDPGAQEDNYDLFAVEVKVVGSREVHHTMSKETPHWDEDIRMIEIRSVARNSSESLSVVRVEIDLQNLLEMCADGNRGFLSDLYFSQCS